LIASTDKFQQLAQLNDMRELKRLLTAEASTLRTAVEAKRQRDEQTYNYVARRTLQSRLVKAEEEASTDRSRAWPTGALRPRAAKDRGRVD
jgi:hypothetical protein